MQQYKVKEKGTGRWHFFHFISGKMYWDGVLWAEYDEEPEPEPGSMWVEFPLLLTKRCSHFPRPPEKGLNFNVPTNTITLLDAQIMEELGMKTDVWYRIKSDGYFTHVYEQVENSQEKYLGYVPVKHS